MKILIVAGEVSGDMHAAALVHAMKTHIPDAVFFGIGGNRMREEGVDTLYDVRDMAVMGLSEVLRRWRFFVRVFHEMVDLARDRQPDAVILVDYPGFNLRLAAKTHAMGLKTIYYICPQVWAWNRSRIPKMARIVDRLITIFPFEPACFDGTGLQVDFVGHPLVDEAAAALAQPPPALLQWPGTPRVALLPGSRSHEVERILPIMWEAAARLEQKHPGAGFIIASPSAEIEAAVRAQVEQLPPGPSHWSVLTGVTRHVLHQAQGALVASGTATIEAALMQCPMVVTYKVAAFTSMIGRLLVRVDHIGMVNIVAGKRICPEFVQDAAEPGAIAEALEPLLQDGSARAETIEALSRVKDALGPGGAHAQAAKLIAETLAV